MLSVLWQAILSIDAAKAQASIKTTIDALNNLVDQQDKIPAYDVAALLRLWGQK